MLVPDPDRQKILAGGPPTTIVGPESQQTFPPLSEALFEQMEESVAVYTLDGRCLFLNPTTERMFGKPRKEVLGCVLWELFPESRNNLFHQAFLRVAQTGSAEHFDHFYEPWQRWFHNRMFLADGRVIVIATDTTRRRQAEEQDRAKTARLHLLEKVSFAASEAELDLQKALTAVASAVVGDLSDSCVFYLLTGDGGQLEAPVVHHKVPEAAEAIRQMTLSTPPRRGEGLVGTVVESGRPLRIPVVDAEALKKAIKPEYHPYLARFPFHTLVTVPLRTAGEIIGAMGAVRHSPGQPFTAEDEQIFQEVADRAALSIQNARLFESELLAKTRLGHRVEEREGLLRLERQARERLSVLAHASQVLTCSLDYETTLRNVVALALPLLGDFGFFDVVEGEGNVRRIAAAHEDPRRQGLLDKTQWVRSERQDLNLCALSSGTAGLHSNIDDGWLQNVAVAPEHLAMMRELAFGSMITVPLPYQGRTLGALTLFYGDSGRQHAGADLQLAEELARRAAASVENARLLKETQEAISIRDDFLSVAGHELRTPLTALQLQLLSVVRMLHEGKDPKKVVPRAEKAVRSLSRFSALVNELLDISRISAGRLTLERETFDLTEAVAEILDRSSEELVRADCPVEFTPAGPAVGTWDRIRIEQVLANLLSNALKYGKGKPIHISVEATWESVRLSVRDFGIGIVAEDQKRVFERFQRAVSSRHFGGLGLGLWVSRQLVEAHGGTIQVESEPGQGASFRIELPL